MNGKYQVGSSRIVTVTHDTPFIEDTVAQEICGVNRYSDRFGNTVLIPDVVEQRRTLIAGDSQPLFFDFRIGLMDENGMDKFVAMLVGMLFMIEHEDVESDQAFGTNWDINDFETGEYDDLFTDEDLDLIKADIKIIKEYLAAHPKLLKD